MKGTQSSRRGISLIVLVITIIVIVILSVSVMLSIVENNPIENARDAVKASDEATLKEAANLAYADWYMQKSLNNTTKAADEYVEEALGSQGFNKIDTDKVMIMDNTLHVVKEPVIPNGFVASQATGENNISTGLVIYEGEDPVTDTNVGEAKTTRNQFVWVPVPEGTFVREDGYRNGILQDLVSLGEVTEPYSYNGATPNAQEKAEYDAMVASVEKYGGFYIARYESGKSTENISGSTTLYKAESKQGKRVYDNIGWSSTNDMTTQTGGVVEISRAMYSVEDAETSGDVVSTLIYGIQWDAIVRWLRKSGYNIQDSSSWGNYDNYNESVDESKQVEGAGAEDPLNTGTSENWKSNNIYDLAGNAQEYTMEACDDRFRICRGGYGFNTSGLYKPVSYRFEADPGYGDYFVGFRLALYIK